MAVMMGSLYNALIAANVPHDQAQKAAEEMAQFDNKNASLESKMSEMRGDIAAMKMVLGIVAALQIMTFGGMVGLLWRNIAS